MTHRDHPLVRTAQALADGLLAPHAARVDEEGVPVSHLDAIRASGLLGVSAPVEYGGAGAPDGVAREVAEILAGACCSTWFVQTQHHTPVRMLARSELPVRERLLGPLATGELLSGVAYAHVRAFPRVPVRVTRAGDGWRFDGTVPWCTGWGLNDLLLLAGVSDFGEVVFAFTEAREQPGLSPSAPMRLAALSAARTVSLSLDGLWLPDTSVVRRTPRATFAPADLARAANTSPAVFGVTRAALNLLADAGEPESARVLRERLDALRTSAYTLAEHPAPEAHVPERLALKTQAFTLLRTATTAALVARGGRSMSLQDPTQRLARAALFLHIQAQTPASRTTHLKALTEEQ
ncbi:acyl-CoA dehydrogenase family protein [Streptomyces sp. NPDC094437]|uniref:acyl-CoA dehydrogenase family protein n=1 Tax=Streptomyces sp. NPDC094437 TaxID=3366060 RepID=UPI00380F31FB